MEDDLIEEVIRVWGYDHIPSTLRGAPLTLVRRPPTLRQAEMARRALASAGLSEVVTYSFIGPDSLKLLGWDPVSPNLLALKNPLSQERSLLRPTLAAGLLEVVAVNLNRRVSDVHCFEIGRVFSAGGPDGLAREELRVGIALTGLRAPRSWYGGRERVDLYDAKGALEHLLDTLGVEGTEAAPLAAPFLEEGRSGGLSVSGRPVGIFGEVARAVLDGFDISGPVYFAECSLDSLSEVRIRPQRYQPLPKFPGVQRDLALVVPVEVAASEVSAAILEGQEPLLRRVTLFDLYSGSQVAAGRKSLAFSLLYQADDRTLTDEEVNALHSTVLARLRERFGAELRGPGGEGRS
jgi:phenylalanyl-tRNA synthetase beta chain